MPSINEICVISNQVVRSLETADKLLNKLQIHGFVATDDVTSNTDLIISIGGDGSFLGVMHKLNYPEIPVLSINTGHLGFFSEINPDEMDLLLESLSNESFTWRKWRP